MLILVFFGAAAWGETSPEKSRSDAEALTRAARTAVSLCESLPDPLTRPIVPCEQAREAQDGSAARAVAGARKVIASLYQSCRALELKVDERTPWMTSVPQVPIKGSLLRGVFLEEARRESYLQAHYLLSQLGDPGPGCVSVKDRPPVYAFGAKSPVKKGKMAILSADLAAKGCTDPWCPAKGCGANGVSCESASVRGLDCTGFVSAAFAAAGLKFSTDPSVQYGSPFFGDTDLLHRLRNFESSCLAEVRTTAEVPLRPGDLINLGSRNGHVVMVESVGADPLGIARSKGDCSKITVKDFDFVFAQSGVPWGVSRVDIQAYRKRVAPVWLSELVTYARNNCEARTARKLAAPSAAKEKQQEASKRVFSVLRHLGSSKSACLAAPLPVEGEECVRTCAP